MISAEGRTVMNKKRIYMSGIIAAASLAYVVASQGSERFSVRSLKGTYGFNGSGTLLGGTVEAAFVGLTSFDRAGGCRIKTRLNAGGQVQSLTSAQCSYTVNPDGTGSIRVTFHEPPFTGPFVSDFVIVDNAEELPFALSDPTGGTVGTGVSIKQGHGDKD
jgi:hypothetical protein